MSPDTESLELLQVWPWKKAMTPLLFATIITSSSLIIIAVLVTGFPRRVLAGKSPAVLALVVLALHLSYASLETIFPDTFVANIFWRFNLMHFAHISFLIGSGKLHSVIYGVSDTQSWYRGYMLAFNPRGIRTEWESQHTLSRLASGKFSMVEAADKRIKLRRRLLFLCIQIAAALFYQGYLKPTILLYIRPTPADYTPEKVNIIRRSLLTLIFSHKNTPGTTGASILREWLIRVWHTVDDHVANVAWLSIYHDAFAILFLGILRSDFDDDWPPLFGSIRDTVTMRGFWALFWHRIVYKSFSYHAGILSTRLLHFLRIRGRRRSIIERYMRNYLVFVISGLMHTFVDWRAGAAWTCALWPDLWYWSVQPVAFALEGIVQWAWIRFLRPNKPLTQTRRYLLRAVERTIGHVWVLLWLSWSYPKQAQLLPSTYCAY